MKLGLIADVHEHVEGLRLALERFKCESVDTVVMLGDVCTVGDDLCEICTLLVSAGAIGVWGNHDYLLCQKSVRKLRKEYSEDVATFMKSLQPALQIDWCHFSHVIPSLDPKQPEHLWYLGGLPTAGDVLSEMFTSVPHQAMFCGHFHKWFLSTPDGQREWNGQTQIVFENSERYFVAMGAAFNGCHAIVDLDTRVLRPFNCPVE